MKNLLKILPLIPLCLACSNDIGEGPGGQKDKTIGFGAKMEQTRAVAGLSDIQANGFSVWGGFSANDHLFDGRKVTYTAPNWVCEGPAEVWTLNNLYSFLAIYPVQNADRVTASTTDSKVHHQFSYRVRSNAETDLLIATRQLTFAESWNGSVDLTFSHALSNINIKVQKNSANSEDNVVVQQISIKNINRSAVYNTESSQWENYQGVFDFAGSVNVALSVNGAGNPEMTEVISGLCFLPQVINANSVQLSITYSIEADGSIDFYTADAYIPETEWKKGMVYTYNLILGAKKNDILFGVPEVQDWNRSEEVGGSIMIQ